MTIKAMGWAWDQTGLPSGAKFVLLVLADHATSHETEPWVCWPSIRKIMRLTELSESTVTRYLELLVSIGLITMVKRPGRGRANAVYDYTLLAQRAALLQPDAAALLHADATVLQPDANLRQADAVLLQPDARSIEGTSIEPKTEPLEQERAKAGFGEDLERLITAWLIAAPDRAQRATATKQWESALRRCTIPKALLPAALRYLAESADVKDGRCKALDRWLAEDRWEGWIGAPTTQLIDRPVFADAAIREAVADAKGMDFVHSYLDPAAWDANARTITAKGPTALSKLGDVRRVLMNLKASAQ
jgi:hypothetical protein